MEVPCRRSVQRRNHEIYFGCVPTVFSRPFRFFSFQIPSFPFPFLPHLEMVPQMPKGSRSTKMRLPPGLCRKRRERVAANAVVFLLNEM